MNCGKILIIEDEKNLGLTLSEYLTNIGHNCLWAKTYKDALALFKEQDFDVVLMDIGLPDGSGLNLAKSFKAIKKNFVLLFLSAMNDPNTRLEGLEIGGDDYITKPFNLKELTLRLERIIRNQQSQKAEQNQMVEIGPIKVWFDRFEVQDEKSKVTPLSLKECSILKMLILNKGKAVERNKIIDEIWGAESFPTERTVDNYIVKLRKLLENDGNNKIKISSVRGVGYKLIIEETQNGNI